MASQNAASNVVKIWSDDDALRDLVRMTATEATAKGAADDMSDFAAEGTSQGNFLDELQPGASLLKGQYVITSFLNSGGFGITYLAKDSLDRTVVIKECFPNSLCRRTGASVNARSRAQDGEFRSVVRLFVQEARSLSKLIHPNIVGVHQVFEDNETAYMAIDYIKGQDLLDIVDGSAKPFTPTEVVQLLKKILNAVAFVHKSGMLHRDISPDNILVDGDQNPVLIDFGAAREQATRASRVLSTRRVVKDGYSPQEFYLSGAAQGPWSDLYALAATFYHVINGAAPVESQRRLAAIAEGDEDPYQPLTDCYDGYPPGFLEAIDQAAKVLPKDRIATAEDWLEIIADGERALAAPKPVVAAPVVVEAAVAAPDTDRFAPAPAVRPSRPVVGRASAKAAARASRAPMLLGVGAAVALAAAAGVWFVGADSFVKPTPAASATNAAQTPDAAQMTEVVAPVAPVTAGTVVAETATPAALPAAGVTVTPVATAAVSPDATASANTLVDATQIVSKTWDYGLPFTTELRVVEGDSVPVITTVDTSDPATRLAANSWIVPGTQIHAINGTWVTSVSAIRDMLRPIAPDATGQISVTAKIRAPFDSALSQVSLVVPATLRIELLNGTVIVSRAEGGQWRTVVEKVGTPVDGGLLAGDIILSEQSLRMAVDSADSVEVMIDFLAFKKIPEAVFDVSRGGQLVAAKMPLGRP